MVRKNASGPILAAAKSCIIAGRGRYEMMDVAKAAGVSEGLAYHYFKSKAGLTKAVVAGFYRDYHAILNEVVSGDIPWRLREKNRLRSVIAFVYQDPLAPIIFGLMENTKEVAEAEALFHEETVAMAIRNLEGGQKHGQIPDHIDASLMGAALLGAVRQSLASALRATPRPDADHVLDQLWQLVSRTLMLSHHT